MKIYTIGFTQKSAEQFFNLIKDNGIEVVVDARLNNSSQLAGFTKETDLRYFLETIADCDYHHESSFAPTKEILDGYKKGNTSWEDYEEAYKVIIAERDTVQGFYEQFKDKTICLLCSESKPEHCHRRLIAEIIADKYGIKNIHHI
jgi:uncharacterized protein (DUF488 family)